MSAADGTAESRYLEGAGGTRLHYRAWPVETPRAAVLVVHGLFEHSRRYEELADTLNGAGMAVFALDQRGHGASDGRRGHVDPFGDFVEDMDRFRRAVTETLPPTLPVFLLGHSMGGLVTLRYLEERQPPVAGAILTSPWLGMAEPVAAWERALAAVLNRTLPRVPYPSGIDPDDLSHDVERVKDYREDPEIYSKLTPRLFHEIQRAWDAVFDRKDRLDRPLLFLLAGADRIADTALSMELAESLQTPDVTIRVLEGYYHEVLQEVDRGAVMTEIVDWIEARLP